MRYSYPFKIIFNACRFRTIPPIFAFGLSALIAAPMSADQFPTVQRGADIDGEAAGDSSGYSISLSAEGEVVAIGANLNDGNGDFSGHTRIFAWNGAAWVQRGADIDGEAIHDQSGYSVSLSADGNVVAIGTQYNDGNGVSAGHTRIYFWNGAAWVQRGADIDGEAAGDQSGSSVSLSADGKILAIGAAYNDGNGIDSGHTRIYAWNGTAWEQQGADIDGEAAGDLSGFSASMNADGNFVAIGALGNDDNGDGAGHTRIFSVVSDCSDYMCNRPFLRGWRVILGVPEED